MKTKLYTLIISIVFMINLALSASAEPTTTEIKKVGETSTLELYFEQGKQPGIILKDKRNGHEWNSKVGENLVDSKNMNALWKKKLKSLFVLYYATYAEKKEEPSEATSLDSTALTTSTIENGIKLDYTFSQFQFNLSIHLWIEGDTLNAKIPIESIKEGKKSGIAKIELMPFFGAVAGNVPGYIFYPDGSGALLYNKENSIADKISKYSWPVYGEHSVDLELYDKLEKTDLQKAMLPVFGIKQADNGFLAIINQGEADSNINLYPNGYIMSLGRIAPEFVYRRFYKTPRQDGKMVLKSEKDIINQTHAVKYVMLQGDNANYSGMANKYRDYLVNSGGINNAIKDKTSVPLGLNLFMGIKESRLIFDNYIAMTTFDNAKTIFNDFDQKGIKNIQLNLVGWSSGGYGVYPESLTPDNGLGGESKLNALAEAVKQKNGTLFLQADLNKANKSNGGFSARNDVIYTNSQTIITDSKGEHYLLNPQVIKNRLENMFKILKPFNFNGLTFENMGEYLYNDYNKRYPMDREATKSKWNEIFDGSKAQKGSTAVVGGNAYSLKKADRLLNIPISDSGYFVTDESIPFYQMVVHGLIPYSSQPGNLFHDSVVQKLKWIEYGCIPFYELTYQDAVLMKDTAYNKLFSSCYKDWMQTATDVYKEYTERLGDTWKQYIVEHTKLAQDVYKIKYQNGTVVYINYSESEIQAETYTINPLDYIVVEAGGRIK